MLFYCRNIVLHKDISSKNVVLDRFLNARLIDFGLAREKNDATTRPGGTLAYLHPKYGETRANESWDYFAFGVGKVTLLAIVDRSHLN